MIICICVFYCIIYRTLTENPLKYAALSSVAYTMHSQVKEKSHHSSFYFWATCGSDVTLSAVLTNKKQCLPPFRRIRAFVYIRRQTIIPSSNADWSISVLFFARMIHLTILHSTVECSRIFV